MQKKLTKYTLLILLLGCFAASAQQDPQYTQYMYNQSVVNPAYTTNEIGVLNFGALYRSQWQSVTGAPKTFSFYFHAPINRRIETGVSVIADNVGDGAIQETNVFADFAYILPLNDKSNISLGLKGGFTSFETDFSGFTLPEFQDDAAFSEDLSDIFPNVGVGVFYTRKNFYVGASAPNLISSTHLQNENGINRLGSEEIHYYLTSGYVYELNRNVKLKPSFLAKMVSGSPITFDASVNALINNRFEAGVSYRLDDSIIGMFNIGITPGLRIGYAYDYTLSNLSDFSSGSHEILVLFNLDTLGFKSGYDKSPRFY